MAVSLETAARRRRLPGELVTFSEASRAIVAEAFPYHAANLRVRPHPVGTGEKVASSEVRRGRPVLGVLGNLAPHKGAGVTAEISRRLAEMGDPAPDLVLIGNLDPAYRLASRHRCHGTYAPDQIADLIRRYGITHWLIPSIWPETFSFTTREALATGLPVLCFDLGAQADAARAQPNGLVLPLGNTDAENVETVLRALVKSAAASEPPATAMDRGTDSP
jgi:O-antigen biosynthesis protein